MLPSVTVTWCVRSVYYVVVVFKGVDDWYDKVILYACVLRGVTRGQIQCCRPCCGLWALVGLELCVVGCGAMVT